MSANSTTSRTPLGKHSINIPQQADVHKSDAKKQRPLKTDETVNVKPSVQNFRAWSKLEDVGSAPCTIYSLKCFFGNPTLSHPPCVKRAPNAYLRELLEKRKLSTEGTKAVMLHRLQTELPYIIFDIDSRECIQRVVSSMLSYFKWDHTHLFSCRFPVRGDLKDGMENFWIQSLGPDFGLDVRKGLVSPNPYHHSEVMRKDIQRKLDAAGMDWSDIERAIREPELMGPWRSIMGVAMHHDVNEFLGGSGGGGLSGCACSLEEYALEKGDSITVCYENAFFIQIMDVKRNQELLPEVDLCGLEARVALVERSKTPVVRNQY